MQDQLKAELLRVARELPPAHLPQFFGDLEEIRYTAEMTLHTTAAATVNDDVLLTVAEACKILKVSKDTLYRKNFPFTVRIGRHRYFSRNGINLAIRQNDLTSMRDDATLTGRLTRMRKNEGPTEGSRLSRKRVGGDRSS